jgi:RNA polymerase sigma-70 factor (ECF subfamily)
MTADLAERVAAAKAGDRAAFDDLVRATYADAYTLAYRLVGNEEDARDVVQDAYLRAYKALKKFREDAAFSTWLYRIVANCASTALGKRSRNRHDVLDEEVLIEDTRVEINPVAHNEALAERDRLTEALEDLPDALRSVVVLRDVYDLPHEAIAAELGISEANAKVRLHRARRKLRETLYPMRGEDQAHAV